MTPSPATLEQRMLVGLFLSKFRNTGLDYLGFSTFVEAYNVIGHAIGVKPTSLKNYRQEFDPLFPHAPGGWHKREMRPDRRALFDRYGHLPLDDFAKLLEPVVSCPRDLAAEGLEEIAGITDAGLENESFSKRLITGISAERFFETEFPNILRFAGHDLSNVTRLGCGFDFRLQPRSDDPFLAVEVKGMAGKSGEIQMTEKEHKVAEYLGERYFLCVVRNFAERPEISIFGNPLADTLEFTRRERRVVSFSWHARIAS